jgi:hypothetical protein
VAEIVEKRSLRPVGRVLRLIRVDEIAREIFAKVFGKRLVVRIIAGIEVSEPNPRPSARLSEGGIDLVVTIVAKPVIVVSDAGIPAANVLRMRPSGASSEFFSCIRWNDDRPLLNEVWFD